MPNDPLQDLIQHKIFPRNLTARADFVVRGNSASTRPESGVDNCYPGLEFDQRNLDKAFFPGLVFEFHRGDGVLLRQVVPGGIAAQEGLADADRPLYLWAVIGRTAVAQSEEDPPALFFFGLNGLEVWRRVHDLLPGRIAVLLGPQPGFTALPGNGGLSAQLEELRDQGQNVVQRNGQGQVEIAFFVGDRARYLDEDGVIDVDTYEPGDLTRSLCAPWQYDFRDCGCFYWAASKPDLVTSADGQHPHLNFQRRDRTSNPPPQDSPNYDERAAQELDYAELIAGAWNDLAVVIDDRESATFTPHELPQINLMSRQAVIDELQYLATVEHALCVQYLYAHYSLNAPMTLAPDAAAETRRIFSAANEIFSIAVDEMRHLRWVNEALDLLGEKPSLDRAALIGRTFQRPFELQPLTPAQLQWFIDVEEPSQALQEGDVDGMYVRLHVSIDQQPDQFPERERLIHLIKLIIDEGEDHYQRFLAVKEHLAGLQPQDYLRAAAEPAPGSTLATLQDLSDRNYAVLLGSLQVTFSLGDRASGILLEQSRRAMFNLHETNHLLASRGTRLRFTLPPSPALPLPADAAHAHVEELAATMDEALLAVAESGGELERALAERQKQINDDLFGLMHQLISEDLER